MTGNTNSFKSRLEALIGPHVATLGYELLDLEYQVKSAHGGPVLRLFIENLQGTPISYSDCAAVDHGLDALLESPAFEEVLSGTFTLEVSSPGLDRPLKKKEDYEKYRGTKALIHTYRALSLQEMGNEKYFQHHQKQKNFNGILRGLSGDSVQMETDKETFNIPLALISKANLDVASQIDVDSKD